VLVDDGEVVRSNSGVNSLTVSTGFFWFVSVEHLPRATPS